MRVLITDTASDELRLDSKRALSVPASIVGKLKDFFCRLKPAFCQRSYWSPLLKNSKVYRRDAFYFIEGLGYIPQRTWHRHSAFLLYQKRYYQARQHTGLED